jgi:dihydrofolate synthase/folylpolyglutamate synthase
VLSFDDAVAYLDSFVNYEKRPPDAPPPRSFGLARIRALLGRLGRPHAGLACLHIAGTKGKGSTAAMTESILRAAGYRTGLYTSPHLVDVRERIRVDGRMISREVFAGIVERTRPHIERAREDRTSDPQDPMARPPTYFEIMTHLAFMCFAEMKVDAAILEVGLGGRLDATNVIDSPVACAITSVGHDHMDILGNTLAEIAGEKAGILKGGVRAVVAPQQPEALGAIQAAARRAGAPLWLVGREVELVRDEESSDNDNGGPGGTFAVRTPDVAYEGLRIPLWGAHQRTNAAVAVGLVEIARREGFDRVTPEAVREGLARVSWPGRIQKVAERPTVVLDGAHNRESVEALREALVGTRGGRFPGARPVFIFAAAADKDWRGMLEGLLPDAGALVATSIGTPRAVSPSEIAAAARRIGGADGPAVEVEEEPAAALERSRGIAGADGLVVAAGSLYLVGRLLPLFEES